MKNLELQKDSELQVASQSLEAANRAAEGAQAELDHESVIFQGEKDSLLLELEQALADKAEAEKQANEDVVRLQTEVKAFKLMKYRDGYTDGAQGKTSRHPLEIRSLHADQDTVQALAPHAPSILDTSATTTVADAPWDHLTSEVPTGDQSTKARQN